MLFAITKAIILNSSYGIGFYNAENRTETQQSNFEYICWEKLQTSKAWAIRENFNSGFFVLYLFLPLGENSAMEMASLYNQILHEYFDKQDYQGLIDFGLKEIGRCNVSDYLLFGAIGKAHFELGKTSFELDEASFPTCFDDAICYYTKAIDLNSDYGIGFYNRGFCYYVLNQLELAVDDLQQALFLGVVSDDIDFYLGDAYASMGRFQQAIDHLTTCFNNSADLEALECRKNVYYILGEKELANKDVVLILSIQSQDLDFLETLTQINQTKEQVDVPDLSLTSILKTFIPYDVNHTCDMPQLNFGPPMVCNCKRSVHKAGIYILAFTNGEYYIGQARDFKARFVQHHENYSDIEQVYVKPLKKGSFTDEETATIALFEKQFIRIRNLKQISFVNIFDSDEQQQWLDDKYFNSFKGLKLQNETLRKRGKYITRFNLLKQKPYYQRFIAYLSFFVEHFIPAYIASEYNYWTITCMPRYLPADKCISRIHINEIPILSIFEKDDDVLGFMLFTSKLPLLKHVNSGQKLDRLFEIPSLRIEFRDAFINITQGDEVTLHVNEIDFMDLIQNEFIYQSIRLFNLRMMNQIGEELDFRRTPSHCLDLADAIHHEIKSFPLLPILNN